MAATDLEIRERDFGSFFEVPFEIYGGRYPFVSPLRSDLEASLDLDKNPLFERAEAVVLTALSGGRPIGRIVGHVHHAANDRFGERAASFGFFDCADDADVARALLERAELFGQERGCDRIRGNMNLTANQEIGVLVEGDERRPYLAQIYNPAYVADLLEACGYARTRPMTTFVNPDLQRFDPAPMLSDKHRALARDPAFAFRDLDRRRFDDEVEGVRQVLNDAMADNYLFVPMTEAEARFQLGPLKRVMDTRLVRIAEHEGEPVGVALAVPDVVPVLQRMRSRLLPFGWWHFVTGRRSLDGVSVIIILVKQAYQSRGVIRVLTHDLVKAAKDAGYRTMGGTWIGDDNPGSLRSAAALGMEPYHRVCMFEKAL